VGSFDIIDHFPFTSSSPGHITARIDTEQAFDQDRSGSLSIFRDVTSATPPGVKVLLEPEVRAQLELTLVPGIRMRDTKKCVDKRRVFRHLPGSQALSNGELGAGSDRKKEQL
jgi:hypothetical protein